MLLSPSPFTHFLWMAVALELCLCLVHIGNAYWAIQQFMMMLALQQLMFHLLCLHLILNSL